MSIFRESSVGSFTRGGQTTLHYVRMIFQVLKQFLIVVIFVNTVLFTILMLIRTTAYERDVLFSVGLAHISIRLKNDPTHEISFELEDGSSINIRPVALINNEQIKQMVAHVELQAWISFAVCMTFNFVFLLFGVRYVTATGRDQAEEEHLRGGALVSAKELTAKVKLEETVGTVSIAGIPLPASAELAGTLICGAPGTGKTQVIMKMLHDVRKAKQRAIVYDVTGSFIEAFYDESRGDVILNPLDARSRPWSVGADASAVWDYENIAKAMIPDTAIGKDPMWAMAARLVFVETCKQLTRQQRMTNKELVYATMRITKEEVIEMLKGTQASSILDKDAAKAIASIRMTLTTFVKCLAYLHDEGKPFSIKDWVQNDKGHGWIFMSTKADQKEAVRPLITTWVDIAARSILSLKPDINRRLWLYIDEVPTLYKLPSLPEMMANGRKYGACPVLGFQGYPQLISVYSEDEADTICELCSTWTILRSNGPKTGNWASAGLGKTEINETREGLSYGANEIRDGVTLSKERKERDIVMSTEISNLPDLSGFIRLGRGFPVAKFKLQYKEYPPRAHDFILRPGAGDIEDLENVESTPLKVVGIAPAENDVEYGSTLFAESKPVVTAPQTKDAAASDNLFTTL